MTNELHLSPEEAVEYAEFLKTKVNAIDEKIAPFIKEKEALLARIAKLNGKPTGNLTIIEKARAAVSGSLSLATIRKGTVLPQTNIGKIKFVIKEGGNVPMATRKILDRIFILMPSLLEEKEKVSKNISTVLSINQGPDKVFKRSIDTNGNYSFSINPQYMD